MLTANNEDDLTLMIVQPTQNLVHLFLLSFLSLLLFSKPSFRFSQSSRRAEEEEEEDVCRRLPLASSSSSSST